MGKKRPGGKAIVVLGSGRSGTSVLARAINIIGVDLGTEFIKANATNPKGFFENKKMGSILKKRPFPEGFQHSKKILPFKRELKEYIRDNFLGKEIWGWKDPRNNEYIELWKDILKELNVESHYLIIIRNPVDAVASYKRAYNRDENWARLQWQLRTLLALRGSHGEKRMIITYEELFGNSLACMRRLAQTFELPWPEDETPIKNALDEFIVPSLQRSNSATDIETFKNREDVEQDDKHDKHR